MTAEIVAQAWKMLQAGQSQVSVARTLRIPTSTLHTVVARQTWRHVTDGLGDLPPVRKGRPFKAPSINQDGAATADRSDLPAGPREPRQRPYKPPEPIRVEDDEGRAFLHREMTTLRKIMHRRFGGPP